MIWLCLYIFMYMYASNILSSLHSFLKGEDIVIGKKKEEEKSILEPVSNLNY